jgi:hypothetical protein
MEISQNINQENLTVLEKQTMQTFIDDLYAEPGFSDVSPQDLSRSTRIPMKSLRGVLGSLSQKGYIWIADGKDMGLEIDIVYLSESFYYLHPSWKDDTPDDRPWSPNPENKTYEQLYNESLNS